MAFFIKLVFVALTVLFVVLVVLIGHLAWREFRAQQIHWSGNAYFTHLVEILHENVPPPDNQSVDVSELVCPLYNEEELELALKDWVGQQYLIFQGPNGQRWRLSYSRYLLSQLSLNIWYDPSTEECRAFVHESK